MQGENDPAWVGGAAHQEQEHQGRGEYREHITSTSSSSRTIH
jgi:hypothetical protein